MNSPCSVLRDRRIDVRTALLVDAALNFEATHGLFSAADELLEQDVSALIVIRVFCKSANKRKRDVDYKISPELTKRYL